MERTQDAERVNAILTDAFGSRMDVTAQVENPANYAMVGEHGCMLIAAKPSKPGRYDLVMGITEPGRGAWAAQFVEEVLTWLFTNTDCDELGAVSLRSNKHVMALAAHATGIEIRHSYVHSFASVTKERWSAAHGQMA
jgi:hypothetical protein